MTYDEALKIMQAARVHQPALAKMNEAYFLALSGGKVIGQGASYAAALRNAGLLPLREYREPEELILYANDGCEVRRGKNLICTARSRNYAHRIANALNAYIPDKKGY
jgi:hypothetical protein